MGHAFSKWADKHPPAGSGTPGGFCGSACAAQQSQQSNKPTPPPPPTFYSPYQRKQKDADTYDSTLGESRFQGTAPRHF